MGRDTLYVIVGLHHPDPNSWDDCKTGHGEAEDLLYFTDEKLADKTLEKLNNQLYEALALELLIDNPNKFAKNAKQFAEENVSELAPMFSGNGTYLFCGYDLVARSLQTKECDSTDLPSEYNPHLMEPNEDAFDFAKNLLKNADNA